jgi:hypothetical protein
MRCKNTEGYKKAPPTDVGEAIPKTDLKHIIFTMVNGYSLVVIRTG